LESVNRPKGRRNLPNWGPSTFIKALAQTLNRL
jgi:hypothetical protein